MQDDELAVRGERDSLAGEPLGLLELSPSGQQPRGNARALDLPLAIGGRWGLVYGVEQGERVVVAPLLVDGAGQVDRDGREKPSLADLAEGLLGRPHVALGGGRVAGQQFDVAAEQLLDGRLPQQAEVARKGAGFRDVLAGLGEAAAHRLEHRHEPRQVGIQGAVLRLRLEQPLEPAQTLRDRHRAVDRAQGVLSEGPADLAAIAGTPRVLGRPGRFVARLAKPPPAPMEVGERPSTLSPARPRRRARRAPRSRSRSPRRGHPGLSPRGPCTSRCARA